jgi:hypothetical protein
MENGVGMWPYAAPADTDAVAARARRFGPLPYSSLNLSGRPVAEGPGPGVGATMAVHLDRWWEDLERPDPFVVVEHGARGGAVAAGVLGASPACAGALRYVLVEADPALRAIQSGRVRLEPPSLALGPVFSARHEDAEPEVAPGRGPLATSLAEPPATAAHVVLAVGWVSTLPWDLWERRGDGWVEVRVCATPDGGLGEILVPAAPAEFDFPGVGEGWRVPAEVAAKAWLDEWLGHAGPARVAVVDRVVASTAELVVAPGKRPHRPAIALDQLDRHRRAICRREPALSPLWLLEWHVGSGYG